jgi:hypothetical protein
MFRKLTNFKNFVKLIKPITSFRRSFFCNIHRLNVDKLKIDVEKPSLEKPKESEQFIIDDNIIEYGPGVIWEETVLKSEIPVVVDVYAK